MPLFAYNRDIPDGPNNPSVDQPDMKTNTNSIDDIIDVDHYSFDEANGGLHRQVRLVDETIPAVVAGQIGVYSKTPIGGQSQEFITSAGGLKEYQMTRFIDAQFAKFSTNGALVTGVGGWTFLPGGMLLQYGSISSPSATGQITFPVAYTNVPYSIQLTSQNDSASDGTVSVLDSTPPTITTFNWRRSQNTTTVIYWLAIGV